MSPFPAHLADRWQDRPDTAPGHAIVYWHVLLGHDRNVRALAHAAQQRLATFTGLHMTPLQWLHITILAAGPASQLPEPERNNMLATAARALSGQPPVTIQLGRVVYHPQAITLRVTPAGALTPILHAAQRATPTAADPAISTGARELWTPHVTLCYSTASQPAGPVIAALGTQLPGCEARIDTLSLVIQHGPERQWNWQPMGTARLQGDST